MLWLTSTSTIRTASPGWQVGGQRLRSQSGRATARASSSHGQRPQAEDQQIAEQVPGPPLADRFADEAQRGERHAARAAAASANG